MVALKGNLSTFTAEPFNEGGETFHWFNPLNILSGALPPEDPLYQFWCQSCALQWVPQLINDAQLQAQTVFYPCMTADEVANRGLCEVGRMWLYSLFWAQVTGNPEAVCGEIIG